MIENTSPNSSPTVGLVPKLTKSEEEVLNIIKQGTIDTKQISIIKKTGIRNIQKIIKSLKAKGALGLINELLTNQANQTNELNGIRLHAQQFLITPLSQSERYNLAIGKIINIDNNTIIVNSDVLQYYCNHSFFGSDSWAATAKSLEYFNRILRTLENQLNCVLSKPRSENITMVKSEYAHIQNGLAKKLEREGEKVKVRSDNDGKVWFHIDNSWNLHEAETIGKNAQRDMQRVIEPFFNDMRDKTNYLPSDTKSMIDKLVETSSNLVRHSESISENIGLMTSKLNFMAVNQESHAGLIKQLNTLTKNINKKINQKKLGEFINQTKTIYS